MTTIAQDTFTRANQSGWGTASGGGTWTTQVSSPTLSIASNEGKSTGINGNDWLAYLGGTTTDTDVYVRCTVSDFSSDGVGIYVRYVDSSNWYRVFLYGSSLAVDKKVAGTFTGTVASSAFSPTNNTFYWIHVNLISSTLKAKVWSGTLGSEPGSWAITTTMSGVSGAGHDGIGAYHNATGDISQFDNFVATDGSTVTAQTVTANNTTATKETVTNAIVALPSETTALSEQAVVAQKASASNTTTIVESSNAGTFQYVNYANTTSLSELVSIAQRSIQAGLTASIESLLAAQRATLSNKTALIESVTAHNLPISSSSDPNAQMLYGDLLIEYAVLRASGANPNIAKIGIALYPPARVINEYAVPGYLAVRLTGEDWSQHHKLRTINDVNAFIAAHS